MDQKSPQKTGPAARTRPRGMFARRLAAVLAGLAVAGLAAVAFVLSHDDMLALARQGGVPERLTIVYPVIFDALLVVAFLTALVLRTGPWPVRFVVGVVVLLLLAAAAAVDVAAVIGYHAPPRALRIGVAAAPWVILLLGFRLWLTMLRHLRGRRPRGTQEDGTVDSGIVPGLGARPLIEPTGTVRVVPSGDEATVPEPYEARPLPLPGDPDVHAGPQTPLPRRPLPGEEPPDATPCAPPAAETDADTETEADTETADPGERDPGEAETVPAFDRVRSGPTPPGR